MKSTVTLTTIFNCSLERAFKTPMLCNVSKVHTGYGIMPKVTHCTEDENWGRPGYGKKVFVAKSPTFGGGEASTDKVLERMENQYWKIEVSDFKSWMLGLQNLWANGQRLNLLRIKYGLLIPMRCTQTWHFFIH
ncbi:MAG: hypothetical protein IPN29_14970 [Saprospiraceae bacterium]|nr:hypothetical protein [Saprospiraceae bacterium]